MVAPRSTRRLIPLSLALLTLAVPRAQSIITIRAGDGGRVGYAEGAAVEIPVVIDMSAAGGANVASLTINVGWTPKRLAFDSVKAGAFGSLTSNVGNAESGSISLSVFDAMGTTSSVIVATLYSGRLLARHRLTPTSAGDANGNSIMSSLRARWLDACVSAVGSPGTELEFAL